MSYPSPRSAVLRSVHSSTGLTTCAQVMELVDHALSSLGARLEGADTHD